MGNEGKLYQAIGGFPRTSSETLFSYFSSLKVKGKFKINSEGNTAKEKFPQSTEKLHHHDPDHIYSP